ncbi:sigma-54-dependent Fis family transcriptional regulator [Vibrio viridaestus]|uniref:AAA family ATPase n=1 Tax=Vibrio viridaestus TaxID=2487322 RepID=A0A3N9TLI6_9VIBR|nr:sigma 54-interacting transcriptional regulator [Vibrio viridaestus]RQW64743.1 AAA family ATPase [Vibrio viridaestus]
MFNDKPNFNVTYDDIEGLPGNEDIEEFNCRLWKGWKKFLQHESPSEIRPSILLSWQRSRNANVDPNQFSYTYVSKAELKDILQAQKELINVAQGIMDNLLAFNPHGHINLTNSGGVTLAYCGLDLTPVGSILTEDILGTNSTARCLIENRLVYTASGENWKLGLRERNQHCAAAPIRNNEGELIGVLTLTGTRGEFNKHTLGTVKAAAEAIEQQLILRQLLAEQRSILETLNEGVIVTDRNGLIKTANRYANQIFFGKNLIGTHIDRILSPEDTELMLMSPCNDREVVFIPAPNQRISCLISLMQTPDGGRVLSLRENKRIQAITRRVMGAGATYTFNQIIGQSKKLVSTITQAQSCSRAESTVLLTGESGTGKELFAQAIHNASSRCNGPFIAVNCGAIPRDLVQSELFGYVSGAYTGARSGGAPGKFELAEGGTLFLDEIGEMPLEAQTSLLRVLQENEVIRIGSSKPFKLNVRIIAATNCDLLDMVDHHSFRRDLYYRLNVISIIIPALRDRKEDIQSLIEFFADRICNNLKRISPTFSSEAMESMLDYPWPGNVRELENIVERILNLTTGLTIRLQDLPPELTQENSPNNMNLVDLKRSQKTSILDTSNYINLEAQERAHIITIMIKNQGNIRKSSQDLGISRPSLYSKLKKWAINLEQFRN